MAENPADPPDIPGLGVDAFGQRSFDPSENVKELVRAENRRQDDLREAESFHRQSLAAAESRHVREILALRTELGNKDSQAADAMAAMRERHATELRIAEAQRIDAIREVDVKAVQQAAEVQATQAGTLAATVADSAEAMRVQMTQATEAATQRLSQAVEPIQQAIESLRRSQYEAQGQKTEVSEGQARGGATGAWIGLAVAGFVAVIAVIGLIATIIATSGGH